MHRSSTRVSLAQYFFIAIAIALVATCPSRAQTIEERDFHPDTGSMYAERRYEKSFQIGPDRSIPVIIQVTNKGNGTMKVANLDLKVFDEHDDGQVFDPPLLHVEFVDI